MRKILVAAFAVSAAFGASCDKDVERLRATEMELSMIHNAVAGNEFTAGLANLSYALNDYSISCGDVEDCVMKLKPKYKTLFQSKGLAWDEASIRAEYRRAENARKDAEKACDNAKKKAILD